MEGSSPFWDEFLERARREASGKPRAWPVVDSLGGDCCEFETTPFPGLTRRRFLGIAAGAAGLAITSQFWFPGLAHAQGLESLPSGALPRPIPGGRRPPPAPEVLVHEFPPGRGVEPSTITDFNGYFGTGGWTGTGTRTNKKTGQTTKNPWAGEIRFFQGTYVGVDGQERRATFSFI